MSVLLLTNTAAAAATGIETLGASIATGYKAGWAMAGPRSRLVETSSASDHAFYYNTSSISVTHCVVTSANYFKAGLNASSIEVHYGASNTADSTTAVGSMTLVGPEQQDWVKTISRTSTKFGVKFNHSISSKNLYGKVYFSNAFDFENAPQIIELEKLDERVRPLVGHQWHQVERAMRLRWDNVTAAKMESFKQLPMQWPFFVFDDAGNIFDHKLEHVVVSEPWQAQRRLDGNYELDLILHRLKHYEV